MSRVKVKICGLRRLQDVQAANSCMPDYAGFVFAPGRRQVDPETAAVLRRNLRPEIPAVGVFVNQSLEYISRLVEKGMIQMVQLHGEEDEVEIARVKNRCGCPVIKAVGVGRSLPVLPQAADFLLFDTFSPARGGTGTAFDWKLLETQRGTPCFLAGGLQLENALQAVKTVNPFCVDVSSGVETDGWKDPEKMKAFVHLIRGIA